MYVAVYTQMHRHTDTCLLCENASLGTRRLGSAPAHLTALHPGTQTQHRRVLISFYWALGIGALGWSMHLRT
jgi:GH24 family phage-related lysozyme (muramidase)